MFYKLTPMTFFFPTTSIKIMFLYFFPNRCNLIFYSGNISISNGDFFFSIVFLVVWLYKIKLATNNLPSFLIVIVYQYFIKYSLSPVIAPIRLFFVGP